MRRAIILACLVLPAGTVDLELRGKVEPAPGVRAAVVISRTDSPYIAGALADAKGRFRFRKLPPGPYTVVVFVPGHGETRRTVEISPSLADSKGVVRFTMPLASSTPKSLRDSYAISARELAIPESARNEYAQAQRDLAVPDADAAKRHLERAVEIAPQFMQAWNHLGTLAYQAGRHPEAEKLFRRALEAGPGAFEPVVNLGGVLLNLRRYEEAFPYNTFAVLERPDDALAQSQLGMNYYLIGQLDQALEHLNIAKRRDPAHFSKPQLLLAEIRLRRGQREAALRELREYIKLHPDAGNAQQVREQIRRLELR